MTERVADMAYRVLVVDDEPVVRELTILALEREGFDCFPANNGEQALKMLEMASYDAIVTDLRMPNLHGHALAVELLAREDRPIIVVVTGVIEPKIAGDLLSRGVDDIFFKPVNHRLLGVKLNALLNQKQLALAASGEPAGF